MMGSGKKAVVLVIFVVILIAPARSFCKGANSSDDGGIFLSLYQEQYQNAFNILIPKGWKPEGGMVPSGVQLNTEWRKLKIINRNAVNDQDMKPN